jgi:hypothetical protein
MEFRELYKRSFWLLALAFTISSSPYSSKESTRKAIWPHDFADSSQEKPLKVTHLSNYHLSVLSQTLTFIPSKKAEAESSMTLNSYLYGKPDVGERLTQGQVRMVEEYINQAAGQIMEYERAFSGNRAERTK